MLRNKEKNIKKFWEWILSLFKKEKKEKEFKDGIIWLHPDVSGWAKTAKCTVNISGKSRNY